MRRRSSLMDCNESTVSLMSIEKACPSRGMVMEILAVSLGCWHMRLLPEAKSRCGSLVVHRA